MTIQGSVTNGIDGSAVAGASVQAWQGNLMLGGVAADAGGLFSLTVPGTPDKLRISSASYIAQEFVYPGSSDTSRYSLYPNVVEGDNVVITSVRKKKFPWLLLVAAGVLVLSAKKFKL